MLAKNAYPLMKKGVIYMLDCGVFDLFNALETISLMDDCEFEKIRIEFEKMDIF